MRAGRFDHSLLPGPLLPIEVKAAPVSITGSEARVRTGFCCWPRESSTQRGRFLPTSVFRREQRFAQQRTVTREVHTTSFSFTARSPATVFKGWARGISVPARSWIGPCLCLEKATARRAAVASVASLVRSINGLDMKRKSSVSTLSYTKLDVLGCGT